MSNLFETVTVDAKMLWTKRYIDTHMELDEDQKQTLYLTALETDLPKPACNDTSVPRTCLYRIFDDKLKTAEESKAKESRKVMPAGIFMSDAEIFDDLAFHCANIASLVGGPLAFRLRSRLVGHLDRMEAHVAEVLPARFAHGSAEVLVVAGFRQ